MFTAIDTFKATELQPEAVPLCRASGVANMSASRIPNRRVALTAIDRSLRASTIATTLAPRPPLPAPASATAAAAVARLPAPPPPPADLDLARRAPVARPRLRAGEADDLAVLVEHGPQAEPGSASCRRWRAVSSSYDGQLGRPAAVELHDVRVGEDPVPGEGVLVGGDTELYGGESSVHRGSPSAG